MKTMKKTAFQFVSALLLSLILAAPASSTQIRDSDDQVVKEQSFDMLMYMGRQEQVNLNLLTHQSKQVIITLKDPQHSVVLRKYLRKSSVAYRLKFNFEGSRSGQYQFEVSDGQRTVVRQIEIVDLPAIESHRYLVYHHPANR